MVGQAAAILDAVGRPDLREDDPVPGRERFYRRHLNPRRWLRVVVDFNESPAFVVAAFVQDNAHDEGGDVLYLSVGSPREATRTVATPEGHAVDYDESDAVIGMILVNVRFLLERDGAVTVTLPPDHVVAAKIKPALIAA